MADLSLLLEAEKRGILPFEKQSLLTEARSRGLVPALEAAVSTQVAPAQVADRPTMGQMFKDELLTSIPGSIARGVKDVWDTTAEWAARLGGQEELERVQAMNKAGKAEFVRAQESVGTGLSDVGRFVGQVGITAPVGGVLAGSAKLLGAAPTAVQALRTWGMGTGAPAATTFGGKAADIGIRALAGAATGGTTAALLDPNLENTGAGAGAGTAAAFVLPPVISVVSRVAGRTWDVLTGRYGLVKAGQIAREAAGGDLAAIKAATAAAGDDLTAVQATAGIKNEVWDALGDLAAQNDRTSYFARKAAQTRADDIDTMRRIAGGPTQTAAREARIDTKANLSGYLGPKFETELAAANIAGQVGPRLQYQADRLAGAATSKVEDVRRLGAAGETAERLGNFGRLVSPEGTRTPLDQRMLGFPTSPERYSGGRMRLDEQMLGEPRLPGRYSYGQELADLAERKGQDAAGASLMMGEGARLAQFQVDSLAAHGLKPLDIGGLTGRISAKLYDPKVGTNVDTAKALRAIQRQLNEWAAKGGGQIDANAIHGIRRNLNNTIERTLGAGDPVSLKAEAARIGLSIKPMLDDAISNAGGTEWRNVVKSWAQGEHVISQKKMGAVALKMLEEDPKKFIALVRGNAPKDVEKVFGAGKFNLEKEMGSQFRQMNEIASRLERDIGLAPTVAGAKGISGIIKEHTSAFKFWNVLDPRIAIMNRILAEGETRIGKDTAKSLLEAMKTGKSANQILNTLPANERAAASKFIISLNKYGPAGIVNLVQQPEPTNQLAPPNQNAMMQ